MSQKLLQRPLKWADERLTLSFWTNWGWEREGSCVVRGYVLWLSLLHTFIIQSLKDLQWRKSLTMAPAGNETL